MDAEKEEGKGEGKKRAEGTILLSATAFPIELFRQWKADCKENFGDCHWIKIWHDHLQSRNSDRFEELSKRVLALELKLENKSTNIEVKTFKKTLKGGD